jgi:hypothetical protein
LWWADRTDLIAADFSFALLVVAAFSSLALFSYVKLGEGAGAAVSGRSVD